MSEKSRARTARLRRTPLMIAVGNAGMRRGTMAVSYLAAWGVCADQLGASVGRDGRWRRFHSEGFGPTHSEYSTYWKQSEAKTAREAAAFRQAFPGETDPGRLWLQIRDQVVSRERDMAIAEVATAVIV